MLRHVGETSATVWVETSSACTIEILDSRTTTFQIGGHHYGLVIVEGLQPGTVTPYEVRIDGAVAWPQPDDEFPAPVIRTATAELEPHVLFGSCRAAAPHEPPFTYELVLDHEGRGVDALWAYASEMRNRPPEEWPDLMVLAGDQIYADDSSPRARERIEQRRDSSLPPEIVADYEEYTWLYREAWSPAVERWFFSVVPTAMIFDDHDMIDDWNISASWVADIRAEPWWSEHVIGGLGSYFVYQHLGNLSPDDLREEEILDRLRSVDDATELLRLWAMDSEASTPLPGGYDFNYARDIGVARLVVIDCRNGRVLGEPARAMLDADALEWVADQCRRDTEHLIIVTSVPVFVFGGLHDIQLWNERVCGGAWGTWLAAAGEKLRRALDLEDWAAFSTSYQQMVDLLVDITTRADRPTPVTVVSGDIHFAYDADVRLPGTEYGAPIRQVVASPLRNALVPPQRGVMRFMLTRTAAFLGRLLARSVGRRSTAPRMEMSTGPLFSNNIGELHVDTDGARCRLHVALLDDEHPVLRVASEN